MENASKALIMAGSILMSVLVIGTLVLLYNQMSSLEQTKVDSEVTVKVAEYLKKFEQYADRNKTYYGSDILSLANLQEEYNLTQTGQKGYYPISIEIIIDQGIAVYFQTGRYDIEVITTGKENIEKDIRTNEGSVKSSANKYKDKPVSYYASKSYKEIALIYGFEQNDIKDTSTGKYLDEYTIEQKLRDKGGEILNLCNDISNYKMLKSDYTSFKNKKFEIMPDTPLEKGIEYDNNTGRLKTLIFKEI